MKQYYNPSQDFASGKLSVFVHVVVTALLWDCWSTQCSLSVSPCQASGDTAACRNRSNCCRPAGSSALEKQVLEEQKVILKGCSDFPLLAHYRFFQTLA